MEKGGDIEKDPCRGNRGIKKRRVKKRKFRTEKNPHNNSIQDLPRKYAHLLLLHPHHQTECGDNGPQPCRENRVDSEVTDLYGYSIYAPQHTGTR